MSAAKFVLSSQMPAVAALARETRWLAKSVLAKDPSGTIMVNLDATQFKAKSYQTVFAKFNPTHFVVETVKGRSALAKCGCVKGASHATGCRRFVPIDTFLEVSGTDVKVMQAAGLIPEFVAPEFVTTEPFYSYVLGIAAVHYDADGNGDHITCESLYCPESAVVATFCIDRDVLRKRLALTPFVNLRSSAKFPERAYRFTDVRALVYRGKLNSDAIEAKFAEFDRKVFEVAKSNGSGKPVVMKFIPNSTPEVVASDDDITDLADAFNFMYAPATEASEEAMTQQRAAERRRKREKVSIERAFVSQMATVAKPQAIEDVTSEDSCSESETAIVSAASFKSDSYDPVLYAAPMGLFSEYTNAEGDASVFDEDLSAEDVAHYGSVGVLFRVGLSINGTSTRIPKHINTANTSTGKVIVQREHEHYTAIHVGHAALQECGLQTLEGSLHRTLRAIDGVLQSNVNGFALDVAVKGADGKPVKSKELFLVKPGRPLRLFQQVLIEFEDKCATQFGILDLIKRPEDTLRHAINRNYICEFAVATESIIDRVSTGVTGIVHDLADTQRSILGFTATLNNQFVEERKMKDAAIAEANARLVSELRRKDEEITRLTDKLFELAMRK